MNRREFVALAGSLFASSAPFAQAKPVRIGVLAPLKRQGALPAILKRLGELGFVEGKNLSVEIRSTDGVAERSPALARELVQAGCKLIFAYGSEQEARALMQATASVPIVILAIDYDPLEAGIVKSLGRPGGNVTGIYIPNAMLAAKRLELLRETLPGAKRVLALVDPYTTEQLKVTHKAAAQLGMEIVTAPFTAPPYDFEAAFEKGRAARVAALLLFSSPVFFEQRARISQLVSARRLPAMAVSASYIDSIMMSYGVNNIKTFERAGDMAANILKGANPGDIAVEQAAVFEFVVSLKAAKALGVKIPQAVLLRADRVIE